MNDNVGQKFPPDISGRNLLALSVVSAIVYLLLSLLIFHYFHGTAFGKAFGHGFDITGQLVTGIVAGCIAAGMIYFVMSRTSVSEVLHDFYIVEMISRVRFTTFDRIQLSLFAGVGEELLFRGAIQPLLGIWLTSVIFVGLHGYFKFKSFGHILFGSMIFGLSVALGYLFEYVGLIAAMSAHAVYDMVMLYLVQVRRKGG